MKRLLNVLITLLTVVSLTGFSQQVRVPNLSGSYIPQVYPLINPSTIFFASEEGHANVGFRQGLSSFSVFKQNNLHVNVLQTKDSIRYQGLGIRLLNDRAGEYIGINRLSVVYGVAFQLSEDSKLSLAAAPSYVSYKKQANTFGGSDAGFNLDIGTSLGYRRFEIGASVNQLAPLTLQVIDEIDSLRQQLTFYSKYNLALANEWQVDLYAVWFSNRSLQNEFVIGSFFTYLNKYRVGTSYELNRDMSFSMGIRALPMKSWGSGLGLDFVFGLPSFIHQFRNRNTIEWVLNYDF